MGYQCCSHQLYLHTIKLVLNEVHFKIIEVKGKMGRYDGKELEKMLEKIVFCCPVQLSLNPIFYLPK